MSCRYWQRILGIQPTTEPIARRRFGAVPCSKSIQPTLHSLNQGRSSSWRTQVQSDSRYHLAQQVQFIVINTAGNNITFSVPTGSKLNGTVNGTAVNGTANGGTTLICKTAGVVAVGGTVLPASIGVFSQSTSVVFGFNSNYDLISSDSQACLGRSYRTTTGFARSSISTHLLKTRSDGGYACRQSHSVTCPGQTIQSCTFELQRVLRIGQAHYIVTITAVTPTTNIGPDHVLWANNSRWSTHHTGRSRCSYGCIRHTDTTIGGGGGGGGGGGEPKEDPIGGGFGEREIGTNNRRWKGGGGGGGGGGGLLTGSFSTIE